MKTTSILLLATAITAHAYNIFDPVPTEDMRELSADRPDVTESPITVDAGHIQIEASVFDWRRDGRDDTFTLMSTNLKFGLTDDIDLQFVFDSYGWENNAGPVPDAEGFGDVTLRMKWNLWGNDEGDTAFALFPFVKIPTAAGLGSDTWEGGLILPFGMTLENGLSLGLMAEVDIVDDGAGGHEFEFLHSAAIGFDLTEKLGSYVEYVGVIGEHFYAPALSGGLTYAVNDNLVLDLGTQLGLNSHAEDVALFSGFTVRY